MTPGRWLPDRHGAAGMLVLLPAALAWGAVQLAQRLGSKQGAAAATAIDPGRVLLWGPLYETVLLLSAAAALTRLLTRDRPAALLIWIAFVASHVAQRGGIALLSLPMAWLLAVGAVRTICQPGWRARAGCGIGLFLMHAWYNAALLWFAA